MAHLVQVGAGSGGMPVLDLIARHPRIRKITLIEPDVYKEHNVVRHLFGCADVGRLKAELAKEWLFQRCPQIEVRLIVADLLDPHYAELIEAEVAQADFGICAADNEPAKLHFDHLMRRHRKPWTLGEVLAGGIGGFVHGFIPGGPCYGCVASFLQRSVATDASKPPDYSQPGGPMAETAIPASKAAIAIIAGLHAQFTLQRLEEGDGFDPGFTSLLFTLQKVPGVFAEAYRPYRFRINPAPGCLICGQQPETPANLDQALAEALLRLGPGLEGGKGGS